MKSGFVHLSDFSNGELAALIDDARTIKKEGVRDAPLAGKSVALVFMNPSLRTRVSFETAIHRLGGHPCVLSPGESSWKMAFKDGAVMDGPESEHAQEAVRVLSRLCSAIALRSFPSGSSWEEDSADPVLNAFRKHATVPVINMESATGHPCQALADLMTIKERMNPKGKKFLLTWAPHVKALPLAVPQSAAEIAASAGMELVIARPPGFDLSPEAMERVRRRAAESGGSVTVTDDPKEGYAGAHVVYGKSWGALSAYGAAPPSAPDFRKRWIVDREKMALTAGALFMHCLPVRRNLVVEDSVLDGPSSVVIDQAENRLYTAEAVLRHVLSARQAPGGK